MAGLHHTGVRIGDAQFYFKLISNLFQTCFKSTLPLHGVKPHVRGGPWFRKSYFALWDYPCKGPCIGSVCENHNHVKPMTSEGAIKKHIAERLFNIQSIWMASCFSDWVSLDQVGCQRGCPRIVDRSFACAWLRCRLLKWHPRSRPGTITTFSRR